jgi:hypothetical protein
MEGTEIDMGKSSRERSVIYSRSSSVNNVRRGYNKFAFLQGERGSSFIKICSQC